MKELAALVRTIAAVSVLFAVQCFAQPQGIPANGVSATVDSDYAITQVGPDSVVWRNSAGQTVTSIATGMNYLTDGGQTWLPSDNSFTISADGSSFVADKLRDPTTIAANINQQGAVSALTPEGATMSSSPTAIVLYDAASGLSAIVGTITNSIGVQVDAQHVVYTNAFSSSLFSASIVYSLPDTGSFHQDVIFTGFNPNFDPTAYGFAAEATNTLQIELLTEFFNVPQPIAQERDLYIEQDPNVRASMASPDFIDYTLDFGHYTLIPGRAYTTSSLPGAGVGAVVVKDFVNTNGRSFLVESLKYQSIATYLQSLPPAKTTAALTPPPHARKRMMAWEGIPSLKGKGQKAKAMKVAGLTPRGVDVDYIAVVSSTVEPKLYTSDTTYFVTNTVYLTAPVTIEAAVFKFPTNQGAIEIASTLTLETTNYRTAIFTSADDSSAGATLGTGVWAGYTGTVTNHLYGKAGLWLATTANVTLNNLRFCYLTTALELDSDGFQQTFSIWNVQMVDCTENIYLNGANVTNSAANLFLYNCLMANAGTAFQMAQINVTNGAAYNCTVDNNTNLLSVDIYSTGGLEFTNSIISSLGSKGTLHALTLGGGSNVFYNCGTATFGTFNTLTLNPYVTAGAGNYYVTNNISYLTNGFSSVPTTLLAELKMKTTQAPLWLTNTINYSTIITPIVARDTIGNWLGFHYESLDFLTSFILGGAHTLTLTNGVALGYYQTGIQMTVNSSLYSQGTPINRNYIAYYSGVQEQPIMLGVNNVQALPILPDPSGSGSFPSLSLRLTTICVPVGETTLFNTGDSGTYQGLSAVSMRDCEIYGSGANWQMSETNDTPSVVLTNNLFYRVPFAINSAATITAVNNLFYGTTNTNEFAISIQHLTAPSPNTNQNNVYDGVSVALDGSTVGYNAYLHGAIATLGGKSTDLTNNVTWVGGPLGSFYQPSGSPLLNNGSESAANLGLYHYTVLTSEAIEGSSTVSRGYHYIALGSGGAPLDNNGDGYPDYLADANGDGTNNDSEAWTGNTAAWIAVQPLNQYALPGTSATFSATSYGTPTVTYQWYSNSVSLSSATSSSYTIASVTASDAATYYVVAANSYGSATSSSATLTVVAPPNLYNYYPPITGQYWFQQANDLMSTVESNPYYGSPTPTNYSQYMDPYLRYMASYQWQSNGIAVASGVGAPGTFAPTNDITNIALAASNPAGNNTITWTNIIQANPGMVETWGTNSSGECNRPVSMTNSAAIAAGEYQSLAATESGAVVQWGEYSDGVNFYSITDTVHAIQPPTNGIVAVAAGRGHALALTSSNTVVAWGLNTSPASTIPANRHLTNIVAVACGYDFSLVLSNNGTLFAWGNSSFQQTNIPAYATNVVAISANATHALAVQSNGTVIYWGWSQGPTNPPNALLGTNTVAVASGANHDIALFGNGQMVAWGLNTYGQTNIPNYQSNAVAIAAGDNHSVALIDDGTVVVWGDNGAGQANVPASNSGAPVRVALVAAGGGHTMAGIWYPVHQYPVNVARDVLLIYVTNSVDSSNVFAYYKANRPMMSSANSLGINCPTTEGVSWSDYTNTIVAPIVKWLYTYPQNRPQYVILFPNVPSRYTNSLGGTSSIQYDMNSGYNRQFFTINYLPTWHPFVTAINMNGSGGVNDCYAYINKLTNMAGANKTLFISASAANYGNSNWYFDDAQCDYGGVYPLGLWATQGVESNGVISANVTYTPPSDTANISKGTNVAGYCTWGYNTVSNVFKNYATNGSIIFTNQSTWYLIATVESFNGQRIPAFGPQCNFLEWFSTNAFQGTNSTLPLYTNTPVGAICHVDEPFVEADNTYNYFGLWAAGKSFSICAWAGQNGTYSLPGDSDFWFQAVGDPFVMR